MIPTALSIAGSDPSGGAGVQADLKTFSARGVYGMTVLTALTAQNTQGVTAIEVLTPEFLTAQLDTVFADVRVGAVKVGMIANAPLANAVAEGLRRHASALPVVVDPVMVAKGGARLLDPEAVTAVTEKLLPCATVITPNFPEAAALLRCREATSRAEMERQARSLLTLGASAVLLKGGLLTSEFSPDILASNTELTWLNAPRIPTQNTHGTGCSLSAAIAAELAKGLTVGAAVGSAKQYLTGAIRHADALDIGHGHGPTHHFFDLWS